jgi:hypothetical protein
MGAIEHLVILPCGYLVIGYLVISLSGLIGALGHWRPRDVYQMTK